MWGQTYFGVLVKDTIYGGQAKLGCAAYIPRASGYQLAGKPEICLTIELFGLQKR
jgi:hypothetical protein